jgi:hypothetical protein
MFRRLLATSAMAATAATAFTTVLVAGAPAPAIAATSAGCESGNFSAVLPSGKILSGNTGFKVASRDLPSGSRVRMVGRYVDFSFDVSTLAVYDYTMTGAPNAMDLTGGVRTPVFASKVPDLGGRTLDGSELEISLSPQTALVKRDGAAGKIKLQVKDCATGGIFQMEPETGAALKVTHTLAPGIFYFTNPYTGKINFGNGARLIGKDSPQVATKLSQSETVTTWSVTSGGRLGGVLGEDAVELSAGATSCVSQCQAQNRIQGSLPVTDPRF